MDSPVLIALWQATVCDRPLALERPLEETEIAWAIEAGMGALLHAATRAAPDQVPDSLAVRLEAAERWARIQSAEALEAAGEIVERCASRAAPLTLLKGISICSEYYAAPHQRFLGDLDLLVEPQDATAVASALAELGYRAPDGPEQRDYTRHHHLRPVRHPATKLQVEVHTQLFPASCGFAADGPFAPAAVLAERRASELEGRRVYRLSPELQVVYIASHWALDFLAAPGARSLLDMALLLRKESRLDWERILAWLEDRRIAAHLQLMLSYLDERKLVELAPELRVRGDRLAALDPAALRILDGMVDRYQVRGLMRHVAPIQRTAPGDSPSAVVATASLRSRLGTLRSAATSGNLRGLLPIFDSFVWERLLNQPRAFWSRLLVPWCRLFPPGDPDRLTPGRRLRR
jgi:hypothetical protein